MLNSELCVYRCVSLSHTDYQSIFVRHASIFVSVISPYTTYMGHFKASLMVFRDWCGTADYTSLENASEQLKMAS